MKFVEPITDPEIIADIEKRLLKAKRIRDYLFIEVGLNTGLRISDLRYLRKRDLKREKFKLTEIKTGKDKVYEMNPTVRKHLLSLMDQWDDDDYILKSRQGVNKPISRSMAYKLLRKITAPYGLESIGNHTLRKTYGYFFYQETKDIAMLQKIFNHSTPEYTLRYIGIIQDRINDATRSFKVGRQNYEKRQTSHEE